MFFTLGVQKAILDNLWYQGDRASRASVMTTLTSPFLAAVTACLVLAWYVSQVQQANIVRGVLMDILAMLFMQGTVNVSHELLLLLTVLIYPIPMFPRGRLCLCMCEQENDTVYLHL